VGIIGAGNFARDFIIPNIKQINNIELVGIATAKGLSAKYIADKYGSDYTTTDAHNILDDSTINCVFILTRHDLHAEYTIQALQQGKNVFVEKPLAVNEKQLEEITQTLKNSKSSLMVGYNRRFSPYVQKIKEYLIPGTPANIIYRVNAGNIPKDSWVHDVKEGGGRIIGEVCHFVDLLMYFTDSIPIKLYATTGAAYDDIAVNIEFTNSTVGTIIYSSYGDGSFPKERIEIFSGGRIAILDDFRSCEVFTGGKKIVGERGKVKKGYEEEIEAFFNSLHNACPSPIPINELLLGTLTTISIIASVSRGTPININRDEYL
jgi:predicted dehydrogenase